MDANVNLQRRHEADALGSMVTRMMRALARRAQEGDELALEQLASLEATMGVQMRSAVAGYRLAGNSWTDVARATGHASRQAAQQRYGGGDPEAAHGPRCKCGNSRTCPNARRDA